MAPDPALAARLVVRGPRASDGEPVGRFLVGLPLASRYHRFFSGIRHVSPALLRLMTTVAPGQVVLLAFDGDTVVGHLMATDAGGGAVDIGIVVAEAYQYRGIGRRLLRELTSCLANGGSTKVRCDVLGANYFVLDWLRRRLPDIRLVRHGETITVHGTLAASEK
ncbi:GNAT family N-acetyltransferase [Amycolatopsis rhabdoformis]|uniref:GNAT family N-acetyltransferase n=1 Tax=Amycolatopsis rhabdoformis TaxID=1448059 RepID=A0ABZ1HV53_9PSEU|nr:GNAT family N-acetyltransferase [Amycolatopsis rhabdoformis]WSE26212.1 GNAT family N-acetyltransferase [Amycolatopsis rhabdoformis]